MLAQLRASPKSANKNAPTFICRDEINFSAVPPSLKIKNKMIFHFILKLLQCVSLFRLTLKGFQPVTLILLKVTSKCFHCTSVIIILILINTILHSICRFVKFYAKKIIKVLRQNETKRDRSFLFHFFVSYCQFLFSTFFCKFYETF